MSDERTAERLNPHLSDLVGYLIRIEDPTFKLIPPRFADEGAREVMTCLLTVLDPPVGGSAARHMAVRYRRFGRPDEPGEAVIPCAFPGAILGAWGLIAFVKRMLPMATSGRLMRFEPRATQRLDGQRSHAGRSYSITPPSNADLDIIGDWLNTREGNGS